MEKDKVYKKALGLPQTGNASSPKARRMADRPGTLGTEGAAVGPGRRGLGGMRGELSSLDFPSDSPDAGQAESEATFEFSKVKPRFRLWLQGPWNLATLGLERIAISLLRFEES